jgi:hypothetical protein
MKISRSFEREPDTDLAIALLRSGRTAEALAVLEGRAWRRFGGSVVKVARPRDATRRPTLVVEQKPNGGGRDGPGQEET